MAKRRSSRKLNVYSNLSHRRKTKKDSATRKKAEYLASLPKHPVKRTLYRMHPKRVAAYWFSKKGGIMALKVAGVGILFVFLMVGALFAYYRKDLDQIRPSELSKRVQTTVTRYVDRNDKLLWEDKGEGNYKLVVKGDEISKHMKEATVALEDKDFYNHHGVSFTGLARATINNATGGEVQGGSTLTQQLVKQVFFADEAQDRGLGGIPRKIKEVILAIEVERMYDKEQILNLYLNESPYGGRRNGVESAAQTYFNTSAKKLTLAQSALLASIPQNPSVYDPYNAAGNAGLVTRQHKTLDDMADQGFITKSEADKAKKVPIIDSLEPETSQYKNIKAPHFVQMVRSELERELGKATVGRGGLTVKTTLDYRVQKKLNQAMHDMFKSYAPGYAGFTNGAGTVEDTKTGQIIAMMGSRDFDYPGFGQDNAATAFIQPGSSIKPLVYSTLFEDKGSDQNFGSGSILRDEPIDDIYGAKLQNADKRFEGSIPIRKALAESRNIPAVKAMYISGVKPTIAKIREAGDDKYCTQGHEKQAGLSAAIGGCGTREVDHVNAFATIARQGVYKPHSAILEVTNNDGKVLKKWEAAKGKKVFDPQSTYIVSDILSDANARRGTFGNITTGFVVPGAKTATKTGTTDLGGEAKDLWMMSYSPVLSMGVWLGNSDTRTLKNGNSTLPGPIISTVMGYAHSLYKKEGKYKTDQWYSKPSGIQTIRGELFPSWYNKNKNQKGDKLTFDKVSKKKATKCTPDGAKVEIDVTKTTDPVTKKPTYLAPDGYDATKDDDRHKCGDDTPAVSITTTDNQINVTVRKGSFGLDQLTVSVDGKTIRNTSISSSDTYTINYDFKKKSTITARVTDKGYYETTSTAKGGSNKDSTDGGD